MLIVAGIIHLLPLSGVIGPDRLTALYGLDFSEPNLAILMRHRAVLLGLFGLFFVLAAFRAAWRPLALAGGFVTVLSFLVLVWAAGGHNQQINRVVVADLIAAACLAIGATTHFLARPTPQSASSRPVT